MRLWLITHANYLNGVPSKFNQNWQNRLKLQLSNLVVYTKYSTYCSWITSILVSGPSDPSTEMLVIHPKHRILITSRGVVTLSPLFTIAIY